MQRILSISGLRGIVGDGLDPNYVLPLVFQGSFGAEYEVARDTTISVNYLNVRGEHLTRTRDVNLYPAVPVSVNLPGLGTRTLLRYPGPQGNPLRPMSHFGRVEVFESGAWRPLRAEEV